MTNQLRLTKDQVLGVEARFAVHCNRGSENERDLHVVKETIHLKDGRKIPNVRLVWDYKRPFYIAKPGTRKYKSKKEWEHVDNLNRYESTQSDLGWNISRALKEHNPRGDLRKALSSPYVYGADIASTAHIKRAYKKKFPDLNTPLTVAPLDVESDVVEGTGEILMLTVSCGSRISTVVQRKFFKNMVDVEARLQEALVKYLGEYVEKRKIVWDVKLVDSELDVVLESFRKTHEYKPDILAVWNINYDIPKIMEVLKKNGVSAADVFSDPSVPLEYKFARYKEGAEKRVTASGKVMPLKPEERWHTLYTPASWYAVDAMCIYANIRKAKGKETSYSLDHTLQKNLGIRKLKFKEADHLTGIDWHRFMQANYPLEYTIYNVFDCVSVEELDEKTGDVCNSFPSQCECSDFAQFTSQPRRVVNELDGFVQEYGYIMGTTGAEMGDEFSGLEISGEDWIITLPAHLVADNGLKIIEEYPDLPSNLRAHTGDLDVAASYPNGGACFNTAKETTATELISIDGVSEYTRRMQGINLSSGATNAVEFAVACFGLPDFEQILATYDQEQLEQNTVRGVVYDAELEEHLAA